MSLVSMNGGAFYRPVFYDFPNSPGAYLAQEYNVMLGAAIKLVVNSNQLGQNSTDIFYPAGSWCSVFNRQGVDGCINQAADGNVTSSTLAY